MSLGLRNLRCIMFASSLLALLAGCGDDDAPAATNTPAPAVDSGTQSTADAGPTVKCGANTQLVDGTCVAAPPVCSDGTVSADGGGCTVAPAPQLKNARLTLLKVNHDLTKPALLNNHLPIRFGVTANSADNTKPVTAYVDVVFSFVNKTPADPAKPETCASNGIVVKVTGDGTEHIFEGEIYPTDDCKWVGAAGATANLAVEFGGNGATFDAPNVVFSTANVAAADNKQCRTGGTSAAPAGAGCVADINLKPTTGVNVHIDSLAPNSSVAIVWPDGQAPDVPAGKKESARTSLVVNGTIAFEGRDPYEHPVDTSKLPADLLAAEPDLVTGLHFGLTDAEWDALDALPGEDTMTYDIVPTNLVAGNAWLPLRIGDPKAQDADVHVDSISLDELIPGADNAFEHALFIEGATRTAVSTGGIWANQSQFTVRACLKTAFNQVDQEGDFDDESAVGGDLGANSDCRTFPVRLSRATQPTGAASSHSFDSNFDRTVGNPDRLAVSGNLTSSTVLDLQGARTSTEGRAELMGKLGQRFNVTLFRVWGKGGSVLANPDASYIDFGAEAFGINIFSDVRFGPEHTFNVPFKIAKSFQFPGLSFGFGPVSVGITVGIGGQIGTDPNFTVSTKTGGEASIPELADVKANGLLSGSIGPNVALTGNVTGGVRIAIAAAEIVATLQVVEIGFPHTVNVRCGSNEVDNSNVPTKVTVLGESGWDLTLRWLNAKVDIVGRLFILKKTINIWKYVTEPETMNLMSRSTPPIVLE